MLMHTLRARSNGRVTQLAIRRKKFQSVRWYAARMSAGVHEVRFVLVGFVRRRIWRALLAVAADQQRQWRSAFDNGCQSAERRRSLFVQGQRVGPFRFDMRARVRPAISSNGRQQTAGHLRPCAPSARQNSAQACC